MPYFIAVYDIREKRVGKMLKLFRKYLTWVQNSVFEGELTDAQYARLQVEAAALMVENEDCIIFYRANDFRYLQRDVLGTEAGETSRFL